MGRRNYRDLILAGKPLVYYRMGAHASSATTGAVLDETGNGYHANTVGTVLPAHGAINSDADSALDFPGTTSDYITNPAGGAQLALNSPVTVEFWNYVKSTDRGVVTAAFSIGGALDTDRCFLHAPYSDDNLYWDYGDQSGPGRISTSYLACFDRWTHVVCLSTGNGGTLKAIYLNGVLANRVASSDGPNSAIDELNVGRGRTQFGYFAHKGRVDEFAVYNRVLDQAEIVEHYRAARPSRVRIPFPSSVAPPPTVNLGVYDPELDQRAWYEPTAVNGWYDWGPYENDLLPGAAPGPVTPQALTVTVTANPSITRVLSAARTLSVAVTATPTIARLLSLSKALTVTVTATPTISRVSSFLRTLSQTVTATPTITKRVAKTLSQTVTATPSLVASFVAGGGAVTNQALTVAVTVTPTISRINSFLRTLSVVVTANPTIARLNSLSTLLTVAVTANPVLSRLASLHRTLTVAVTAVPFLDAHLTGIRTVTMTVVVTVRGPIVHCVNRIISVFPTGSQTLNGYTPESVVLVPGDDCDTC